MPFGVRRRARGVQDDGDVVGVAGRALVRRVLGEQGVDVLRRSVMSAVDLLARRARHLAISRSPPNATIALAPRLRG